MNVHSGQLITWLSRNIRSNSDDPQDVRRHLSDNRTKRLHHRDCECDGTEKPITLKVTSRLIDWPSKWERLLAAWRRSDPGIQMTSRWTLKTHFETFPLFSLSAVSWMPYCLAVGMVGSHPTRLMPVPSSVHVKHWQVFGQSHMV